MKQKSNIQVITIIVTSLAALIMSSALGLGLGLGIGLRSKSNSSSSTNPGNISVGYEFEVTNSQQSDKGNVLASRDVGPLMIDEISRVNSISIPSVTISIGTNGDAVYTVTPIINSNSYIERGNDSASFFILIENNATINANVALFVVLLISNIDYIVMEGVGFLMSDGDYQASHEFVNLNSNTTSFFMTFSSQ